MQTFVDDSLERTYRRLRQPHDNRVFVASLYRFPRQIGSCSGYCRTFGEVTLSGIALIGIDDIIGSELPTTYQATGLTVWIESVVNALTDVEYVRQGVGRFPAFRQLPGESKQRNVGPVKG